MNIVLLYFLCHKSTGVHVLLLPPSSKRRGRGVGGGVHILVHGTKEQDGENKMKNMYNHLNCDSVRALEKGEKICFWCRDPFWKSQPEAIIIERTVCDTNGGHIEETWIHKDCALMAMHLISSELCDGVIKVWSN